jgi:hypothetical protein
MKRKYEEGAEKVHYAMIMRQWEEVVDDDDDDDTLFIAVLH